MTKQRYKYNVINELTNKEEPWTGIFESAEKADIWYNTHGKFFEERGHKLVRVKCGADEKDK